MSWLDRAIHWRRYFEASKQADYVEGTKLVHRWLQMFGWSSGEWSTRVYRALDDTMAKAGHDGASGWGMFRNDVTTWLASWVRDHGKPDDRDHFVHIAACIERYLRAIGSGHASSTSPLAGRWRDALAANDATAYAAVVDEARALREMHTAGAGGVLPLIEACARVIDGATCTMSTEIRVGDSTRSETPLAWPIELRVWPSSGGEHVVRFDAPQTIEIGRATTADVRIEHDMVARAHARIVPDGDAIVLEDRRSENGTAIFERRIEREVLRQDDVIVLGNNLVLVSGG